MTPADQLRVITSIYDAAVAPELWPIALRSASEALGAVGAAYLIENRRTGLVEWASQVGPAAESTGDYLSYYSKIDPFRPLHGTAPMGSWLRLTRCLPKKMLSKDEWYNDFVLKTGVEDVLGARLFNNSDEIGILGIHQSMKQASLAPGRAPMFGKLLKVLTKATQIQLELRRIGWQSHMALQSLDKLPSGVIVTTADGRVVKINSAAEAIVRQGDSLTIRNARLCSQRTFETERLAKLIANATPGDSIAPRSGRIAIGKLGEGTAYVLTVVPLSPRLIGSSPLAMISVTDVRWRSPSERALQELFGLSPAESRLAAALMTGKRLNEVATSAGVKVTTLRTQLSSILKKVGVERQTHLVQILSKIQAIEPS